MTERAFLIHASEPAEKIPVSNATKTFVDRLEADLGNDAKPTFTALSKSLDDLSTRLSFNLAETIKKRENLDLMPEVAAESDVRVVDPNLPDMGTIQNTIGQTLPAGSSPEINELHRSTAQANIVRDPSSTRGFEKRKASQIRANLQKRVSSLGRALNNVNALNDLIKEKIS